VRALAGLAGPGGARSGRVGPPRWKLAVLAWAGAFPTVAVLSPLLNPHLVWLPPVVRTAVIVAIMIVMMTFVWMPLLTRTCARWLARQMG
jgi:antibiotic biosynthesis monooxygenase (ABM) superfamily enzyme